MCISSIDYIDLHCDTAGIAYRDNKILSKNNLHVDFNRMGTFKKSGAFFAVWVTKEYHANPFQYTKDVICFIQNQAKENHKLIDLITPVGLLKSKSEKPFVFISIEGGDALEGNIENIEKFKQMGVSLMSLTWNGKNDLACGVGSEGGLTTTGKKAVKELERCNIILDVSHLNDESFKDICDITKKPFIASHSNARAICRSPRNLKNWQIREIADRGGVIGLNLFTFFVKEGNKRASIKDLLNHAEYIANIAKTEDCLSIGTDFDGINRPIRKMKDILCMNILKENLIRRFGQEMAEKILWKNVINFFEFYYTKKQGGY